MLNVSWTKCAGNAWCQLEKVDVARVASSGVFIVWASSQRPRAVRIGYGPIAQRVRAQRHDANVMRYRKTGTLYVTWVALPDYESQGVMIYLSNALRPFVRDPLPPVGMIEVNLPFTPSVL
jgi:hypothetical protein